MSGNQRVRTKGAHSTPTKRSSQGKKLPKLLIIPVNEWPILRDIYKINWPKYILSFNTIQNYINWHQREPDINVHIYTTDRIWPQHGTYILVDRTRFRCNVSLNSLYPDNPTLLKKALNIMDPEPSFTFTAYTEPVSMVVQSYLEGLNLNMESDNFCRTSLYYLPYPKNQNLSEVIPEGFDFRPLVEGNARRINEVWPHRYLGSEIKIRRMIQHNLSQGAFHTKTGELCGWVMITQVGTIGILQVEEAFKRRGIGKYLVIRLCKMLAASHMDAIATVADGNHLSQLLFEKLGFTVIDRAYWFDKPSLSPISSPSLNSPSFTFNVSNTST